jgi:cell division protein FtsB
MNTRRGFWGRLRRRLGTVKITKGRFYLIGIVILFLGYVAGSSGFVAQIRLWQQGRQLQKDIEIEKKKKEWMKREAESLANDRNRIKREAQKEHSLGEPDEIIVQVQ